MVWFAGCDFWLCEDTHCRRERQRTAALHKLAQSATGRTNPPALFQGGNRVPDGQVLFNEQNMRSDGKQPDGTGHPDRAKRPGVRQSSAALASHQRNQNNRKRRLQTTP